MLFTGIIGSGFEKILESRRNEKESTSTNADEDGEDSSHLRTNSNIGDSTTIRGSLYNFLHLETSAASWYFDQFINFLVVASSLVFMLDTVSTYTYPVFLRSIFDAVDFWSVVIFTVEYVLKLYSITEDPKYKGTQGRVLYASSFLAIVHLLSFLPYWIYVIFTGSLVQSSTDYSVLNSTVRFLSMLRILRFEKYTKAFTTFDDIIRENMDILGVTGFSALLMWILFSAILYLTEKDNPNEEMANFYKSVPHAMWITLLNLSGEQYCVAVIRSPL